MYWRRWRLPSMHFLMQQRSAASHVQSISKNPSSLSSTTKQHKESSWEFQKLPVKANPNFSKVRTNLTEAERDTILDGWKKENEHPSSTAAINVQGQVRDVVSHALESIKIPKEGPLNSPESLDKHEVKGNSYSFLNSTCDSSFEVQPARVFKIDAYDGKRPSFAFGFGGTSTPISKAPAPIREVLAEEEENVSEIWQTARENLPEIRSEKSENETIAMDLIRDLYPPTKFPEPKKVESQRETDNAFRSFCKRTVGEKVTTWTKKNASAAERKSIFEFFKEMLSKHPVLGFNDQELQISTDAQMEYSMECIIEKYAKLVVQDNELIGTVSHVICKLCYKNKTFERAFIDFIMSQSVLLRYNAIECDDYFSEMANRRKDERALALNHEKSLISLFMTVHTKNAVFSKNGVDVILSEDKLQKLALTAVHNAVLVRRSSILLTFLITDCKPILSKNEVFWADFVSKLRETLPCLEEEANSLGGDDVSSLAILQNYSKCL
ncbi:unnamed protein product [Caenorhabditis auriculariae]|uniref:Uncharacterized protein n=1 Tax=Caenorhabditis auriculariae TaxID=2777116 RepID=A0A8S1GP83_9PELO|nr:unnamed protein product [Caenorhabditis auriculariae]